MRLSAILRGSCLVAPFYVVAACSATKEQPGAQQDQVKGRYQSPNATPCSLTISSTVKGRLGPLRVGMSVDSLLRLCPATRRVATTDVEGATQLFYYIPVTDRDTVVASVERVDGRDMVRSFSIDFSGPTDSNGLGVGKTFGELRRKYAQFGADDNEGRVYVWPKPDIGLSFALGVEISSLDNNWRINLRSIPDSTHVIELLIR